MKRKTVVFGIAFPMIFTILLGVAICEEPIDPRVFDPDAVILADSRYTNSWGTRWVEDYTTAPLGDQWHMYIPDGTWHTPHQHFYYPNRFAEVINQASGFQWAQLSLVLSNINLRYYGTVFKTYIYPEAKGQCGARLRMVPQNSEYKCDVYLAKADGSSETTGYYVDSYKKWNLQLIVKFGLSKDGNGAYNVGARAVAYAPSTGETVVMKELYFSGSETHAVKCRFDHEVEITFGTGDGYSTAGWDAYFTIPDIGIREDLALQDCKCNVNDQYILSTNWGRTQSGVGNAAWFWTYTAWKGDCNVNKAVDQPDQDYITLHYGHSH